MRLFVVVVVGAARRCCCGRGEGCISFVFVRRGRRCQGRGERMGVEDEHCALRSVIAEVQHETIFHLDGLPTRSRILQIAS